MILGVAFDREQYKDPNAMDFNARVRMHESIGDIVNHSPNTLISAPDDGSPLRYHGWIAGEIWPTNIEIEEGQLFGMPELDMEQRLNDLKAKSGYPPDYFIIVRDLNIGRFEDQKGLNAFLVQKFPIVAEGVDYWVFDLERRHK